MLFVFGFGFGFAGSGANECKITITIPHVHLPYLTPFGTLMHGIHPGCCLLYAVCCVFMLDEIMR